MPRYFFDIAENGELFVDEEGTELAGHAAVAREAAQVLAELAKDRLRDAENLDISLSVRDDTSTHVLAASLAFRIQ